MAGRAPSGVVCNPWPPEGCDHFGGCRLLLPTRRHLRTMLILCLYMLVWFFLQTLRSDWINSWILEFQESFELGIQESFELATLEFHGFLLCFLWASPSVPGSLWSHALRLRSLESLVLCGAIITCCSSSLQWQAAQAHLDGKPTQIGSGFAFVPC